MKSSSVLEFPECISFPFKRDNRHAVILAGGDGTRLRSLTRMISGDDRPKQFCPVLGGKSLLENTASRVSILLSRQNIYYSLTEKHGRFYDFLLARTQRSKLIIQPENKGTSPAILYSLFRIAHLDPEASIGFFPSDHHFSDNQALMLHVERAFKEAEKQPDRIVLLGIEPEKPETSYGWIEPVETTLPRTPNYISGVRRFWEKPPLKKAESLMKSACLWNSFVMIGKLSAFLKVIKKSLPDLFNIFEASSITFGTSAEKQTVRCLYDWIEESNFSSEVLEQSAEHLRVLRVSDVGWSDLGEPQRVFGTLTKLGVETRWMEMVS